jgi:hypothetical protein
MVLLESDDSQPFTDEELTALALAADPDAGLADDAVPLWDVIGCPHGGGVGLLPAWYMPSAIVGSGVERRRWHRALAVLIILSFLVIDAVGLCITYGQLVVA